MCWTKLILQEFCSLYSQTKHWIYENRCWQSILTPKSGPQISIVTVSKVFLKLLIILSWSKVGFTKLIQLSLSWIYIQPLWTKIVSEIIFFNNFFFFFYKKNNIIYVRLRFSPNVFTNLWIQRFKVLLDKSGVSPTGNTDFF